MSSPYGHTRTRIAARHALIAPDGHVKSCVPGFSGADVTILISGAMGARLTQMLATFTTRAGGCSIPANGVETFGYIVSGSIGVKIGREKKRCAQGGFFYAPAGHAWTLASPTVGARVCFFQKTFEPAPAHGASARIPGPKAVIGDANRVKGNPFLGDPDARLQVLLPDEPAYDMAVNIFTYRPGATLPFVETHIMEHGLLMLAGQGVYRLEDSWYPVAEGDTIWMAPYCPQWFVAMGKTPASYLYYKDVNRSAI